MKKYYLMLSIAIGLVSCGEGETKSQESEIVENEVIEDPEPEIEEVNWADEIIGFNNEVIDYLNETSKHVERTVRFSDGFAKIITNKSNNVATNNNMAFIGKPLDMAKVIKNAPKGISESLKNNLKEIDESYSFLEAQNKLIYKYRNAQDYKDDDWKKGEELLAEMNEGIDRFYSSKDIIVEELQVLADKAEEKSLEGHPLKDPILAAKSDLNQLEALQSLIFAEELDRDAIQIAYDDLEKNSKKHRTAFNTILEEYQKEKSYNNFHENIDSYLGVIRKVLRYDRLLNENDVNMTLGYYKTVISGYNSFVD